MSKIGVSVPPTPLTGRSVRFGLEVYYCELRPSCLISAIFGTAGDFFGLLVSAACFYSSANTNYYFWRNGKSDVSPVSACNL
jgi:hypothetical protein